MHNNYIEVGGVWHQETTSPLTVCFSGHYYYFYDDSLLFSWEIHVDRFPILLGG